MALGIRMEHDPRRIRVPARVMKRGHDRQKRPIPHLHGLGPPNRHMPFPHTTAPSPRPRPAQDHHTGHETVPDPTGSAGTRRRSPAGGTPSPGSGAGTPTTQGGNCARRPCRRCARRPCRRCGRRPRPQPAVVRMRTVRVLRRGTSRSSGAARSPCESQPRWIFSTHDEWVSAANAPRRVASRIESPPGGRTPALSAPIKGGVHDRQAPRALALPRVTALPLSLTPVTSPAPSPPGAPLRLPDRGDTRARGLRDRHQRVVLSLGRTCGSDEEERVAGRRASFRAKRAHIRLLSRRFGDLVGYG